MIKVVFFTKPNQETLNLQYIFTPSPSVQPLTVIYWRSYKTCQSMKTLSKRWHPLALYFYYIAQCCFVTQNSAANLRLNFLNLDP